MYFASQSSAPLFCDCLELKKNCYLHMWMDSLLFMSCSNYVPLLLLCLYPTSTIEGSIYVCQWLKHWRLSIFMTCHSTHSIHSWPSSQHLLPDYWIMYQLLRFSPLQHNSNTRKHPNLQHVKETRKWNDKILFVFL